MTTIAYRNGIIASDSQITYGNAKLKSPPKIFVRENMACAVAGNVRVQNIFEYSKFPTPPNKRENIDKFESGKWIHEILIPWMRERQIEVGFENSDSVLSVNEYIIYIDGEVFMVDSTFTIMLQEDFCAIGSGAPYALGAMHAGASAKEAIFAASKFDLGSSGDLQIVNMRKNHRKGNYDSGS